MKIFSNITESRLSIGNVLIERVTFNESTELLSGPLLGTRNVEETAEYLNYMSNDCLGRGFVLDVIKYLVNEQDCARPAKMKDAVRYAFDQTEYAKMPTYHQDKGFTRNDIFQPFSLMISLQWTGISSEGEFSGLITV